MLPAADAGAATAPVGAAAAPVAPALEVSDLQVWVMAEGAKRHLVERVGFAVRPGTVMGIVGETGAGKTMTVRSLLGLLPPGVRASGTLRLDGRAAFALADHDRLIDIRG